MSFSLLAPGLQWTELARRTFPAALTDTLTGIPAAAKIVVVSFQDLAKGAATSDVLFRIGPSGGIQTTGYNGVSRGVGSTTGLIGSGTSWSAIGALNGSIILNRLDATNNVWAWSGVPGSSGGAGFNITTGGSVALTGPLERMLIGGVGGADANFSAGFWQASYAV